MTAISQHQVRLENVNMQEKLFIRGQAPSQDAKNKVWDQIKSVDPSYSDLIADITVNESEATRGQAAGASVGGKGRIKHDFRLPTQTLPPKDSHDRPAAGS